MHIEVLSYGETIYSHGIPDSMLKDIVYLNQEENYKRRELIIQEHIRFLSGLEFIRKTPCVEYCLCFESRLNKWHHEHIII